MDFENRKDLSGLLSRLLKSVEALAKIYMGHFRNNKDVSY